MMRGKFYIVVIFTMFDIDNVQSRQGYYCKSVTMILHVFHSNLLYLYGTAMVIFACTISTVEISVRFPCVLC